MSIESAKAFLERVQNDEDFRKELEAQTSKDERMKFAKAQGFDFTKEEIESLTSELSDEEMDGVSGGSWIKVVSSGGGGGGCVNVGGGIAS